jgi:diaminohydroxyphosphoribosylaminopyrimidine deaminase/5-amino-6-(5-phosphoribosylamino)uracil reductase
MSLALDRLFMQRARELAERARGNVAPNPLVGAVLVRGGRLLGEGFHHQRGQAHAEVEALRAVGGDARGSTLYVTLEPCAHHGLTPPCARAILDAGVARVVIGALDPNPKTAQAGVGLLREHGVDVEVLNDARSRALIEDFAVAITRDRPFVTLKLAASLDGYVAPKQGRYQLTGTRAAAFTRELRAAHDAVMVGAGTVRVDNPLLTVRPPRARLRPYVRVVACERVPVWAESRIFATPDPSREGLHARTIVLAPAGARAAFASLERVAEVVYVGESSARELNMRAALAALKERGVYSILSEGGPTLASRLLAEGLVDRLHWLAAPLLLAGENAVRALQPLAQSLPERRFAFEEVARLGDDVLFSASFVGDAS